MGKEKEKKPAAEGEVGRAVEILRAIQKEKDSKIYGIQMLDATKIENVPRVSSGVLSVDLMLGGGYPIGRIIEIFGPEGGGKTTLALHAIAEANRRGSIATIIDLEHAYDPFYGKALGVDSSKTLVSQPDNAEAALTLVENLALQMKPQDIILIDSVAALTPEAELAGEMGDAHVGLQARLMSQALRKMVGIIDKSGVVVIFINQIRMKIGVMFGSPETTTGGNALKFYASQRIDIRAGAKLKAPGAPDGAPPIGQVAHVKIVKNKVAPPFKSGDLQNYYGWGFWAVADIFNLALAYQVISSAGGWYIFNDECRYHGEVKAKEALSSNPQLLAEVRDLVLKRYNATLGS
jgi:recombination protein RecA